MSKKITSNPSGLKWAFKTRWGRFKHFSQRSKKTSRHALIEFILDVKMQSRIHKNKQITGYASHET